jgi:hypothetical protein
MRSGGGAFRDPPTGNHEVAQIDGRIYPQQVMKTRFKSPGALISVLVLAVEKVPVAHHVMDNISGWSEGLPSRVGKREALQEGLTC